LDAAFFAIYLDQGPLNDFSRDSVYNYAMNEIALFKKYIAEHSDEAEIGYAPEDLKKIKKKGKRCVVFALENGYGIGKDLDKINKFYDEGVRYITLCHNYVNDICDASRYTKGHSWGGLSEFGYKVVERMNELGMIIDFSHASSSTLWDLLECSKAPVIATHSSVWELKKNNRNLKDDEIKAIAKAGGLIQLASGRFFLSDLPKKEVTIKHLADHIDYIKNLVGVEYIGLGTDFDGGGGVVGLEDCSKMKDLTKELLLRGYTPYELSLFWGGNFLRVWQKIIDVSKELKKVK
jgi:membrane dipeptidase